VSAGVSPVGPGPLVILKFGSSVLRGVEGFRGAAREVASEVAAGRQVIAVVSAAPGVTDALLRTLQALDASALAHDVARVLATAEATSVALLDVALKVEGVAATGVDLPVRWLTTSGPPLDAAPLEADRVWLRSALDRSGVLVLPGFVGCEADGRPTVLGRGGSDLSAIFLAWALDASECRLVKDVDGVYSADPNGPGVAPFPYRFASWDRVLEVARVLVQPKAVCFARDRGLRFRVAGLGGLGTWVGTHDEVPV